MVNLEISETKEKKLDELESQAITIIGETLKEQRDFDDLAKTAIKLLGVVAKNRQTLTARSALGFNMAWTIGTDKEIANYIKVTNPVIRRQLQGKKG